MAKTVFHDKKEFQNLMVFEKHEKKFFRKTGLPAKPEYPENRESSETIFPDSFLKLNSLQAYMKKNQKID